MKFIGNILAIHWCQWQFIGSIGVIDDNGAYESISANGIIFTIVAIGTIVTIGVIFNIAVIVSPMYHHCFQWIVIVAIVANVANVAIGHHWCHQLS